MPDDAFAHFLVVDFEATCCDRGGVPRDEMEIIEFGAAIADAEFRVVDTFQSFVRPVRHPRLTGFCTGLTTIRQADVDAAAGFAAVLSAFAGWLAPHPGIAFCSWGDYDARQLQQDCAFHGLSNPLAEVPHRNVKRLFAARQRLAKPCGLGQAVRLTGLEFAGTQHRGIDDARNIARLLPFVFGEARLPQKTRA